MNHFSIQLALFAFIHISLYAHLSCEDVPCQCGEKSDSVPKHAKNVRLADIEIIGAIGDSDSAAYAANSNGILDYMNEYWGVSFVTGFVQRKKIKNILSPLQELMVTGLPTPPLLTCLRGATLIYLEAAQELIVQSSPQERVMDLM